MSHSPAIVSDDRQMPFSARHIGIHATAEKTMLSELGYSSRADLITAAVPAKIRLDSQLNLPAAMSESDALEQLRTIMDQNEVRRSLIGQGYYGTHTPAVIQRNILENPGWYTAYTPYQAEISQGRLEALLNFQTMVCDLTRLPFANASLLDEGTAVAEAMSLALSTKSKGTTIFASDACHPQTLAVLKTRAEPLGITVLTGSTETFSPADVGGLFAVVVQYPESTGGIRDYAQLTEAAHAAGALVIAATDLLALTLLRPPGEWGADIAVGSAQRFGVPLGYGGPHAAFIACTDKLKRKLPGRLVGVSIDSHGNPAYRLTLQTREQHIRRDKATSNICTAQVLLAVMASMYAVYHGASGLKSLAQRIHRHSLTFAGSVPSASTDPLFDTVLVTRSTEEIGEILIRAEAAGYNLRRVSGTAVSLSFDELTTDEEVAELISLFSGEVTILSQDKLTFPDGIARTSDYLQHPVFQSYRSETEMLRYLKRLESRDLALNESMIALGSCTMKLNATSEMLPLSWPTVGSLHPFAPAGQARGYRQMLDQLADWLAEITRFEKVSLQPNAGSQGEYAGLLAIRRYHLDQGDTARTICLIPQSAHGTNPASAVMAGFKVVGVACDDEGNIDIDDLNQKIDTHREELGALMVTYPSTHGVFEEGIKTICGSIHAAGGLVYMDGANMNAQVGLTSPGAIGADVCHLNLHKTFCIPHGGGGPGVGPIGVVERLVPYLPGHTHEAIAETDGAVCSAPYGSASINTISWMYIAMMGARGLTDATEISILNANYMAQRLRGHFLILYKGRNDLMAHECIIDLRPLTAESGITVEDVAKRLADYGFHSPTMSWPVTGTLMIEPTESESLAELDRFCGAMISIRKEIDAIISGAADTDDNVLKNAPHTADSLICSEWSHPYSREEAAYPAAHLKTHKFWPYVGRVDNVHGDRHIVCTCGSIEDYE